MLRLPRFGVARPATLAEATRLLSEQPGARVIAGGSDLLPNMKHRLLEPELLVALGEIRELVGIARQPDGALVIGALTPLSELATDPRVPPALAQAASLVASPQIRRVATLGGNLLSDTRCRYYNKSHFWRQALGFCLKKDGSVCHVVEGGTKCVAAVTSDSAPALMTLGASLCLQSIRGQRQVALDDFFAANGADHRHIARDEILTEIRIPALGERHRGAYAKLRLRDAIDFPLLGVAVRVDLDATGAIADADVVCGALVAKPLRVPRVRDHLRGVRLGGAAFDDALRLVAERARTRCHPLPNIPGDAAWRREMVSVLVRRALAKAVA